MKSILNLFSMRGVGGLGLVAAFHMGGMQHPNWGSSSQPTEFACLQPFLFYKIAAIAMIDCYVVKCRILQR